MNFTKRIEQTEGHQTRGIFHFCFLYLKAKNEKSEIDMLVLNLFAISIYYSLSKL